MKKNGLGFLALLLVICLSFVLLTGCGSDVDQSETTTTANKEVTTTVGGADPTEGDGDPTGEINGTDADPTAGDGKTDAVSTTTEAGGNGDQTTVAATDKETDSTTPKTGNGQLIGPFITTKSTVTNPTDEEPQSPAATTASTKRVTTTDKVAESTKKTSTTKAAATTRPPAADASNFEDVKYVIRQEALDLRLTQEVLDRSILHEGDNARVAAFLKKAMRGEAVTIGVIGGSITQGSSASTSANKYAERFVKWFKQAFPNTAVTFINAGLGATDSLMGVHRVDNDLLKYEPDLVIVEFSVNDGTDNVFRETYEGLMRKILKTDAAVIALQMMNQDGANRANLHTSISRHYDIPTISYLKALWPSGKDGSNKVYQWGEISPDNIHPNDTGHAIVSELLISYINTVRAQITTAPAPITTLPAPRTDNAYENAVLLNSSNCTPSNLGNFKASSSTPQFPNGWHTTNGGNQTFVLEVEDAKNLSLLYWKQSGASGSASIKIDGAFLSETIKSDNTATYNYAKTIGLVSGDTAGKHKIEITCSGTFWILGILKS